MPMAKLHSLIKFKRHELDEKREILSKLNDELERLKNFKQQLLDNLAREKNLAAVDIDIARSFGPYLNKTLAQCADLDNMIRAKLQEVQAATHVVQDAYLEVKKLEITQDKRDDEEDTRIKKIETNTLDDIGIESFRRGQDGRV
jgi:flagellar FliJ protein